MGIALHCCPELLGFVERRRAYKNADNGEDRCVYSGLTAVKIRERDREKKGG